MKRRAPAVILALSLLASGCGSTGPTPGPAAPSPSAAPTAPPAATSTPLATAAPTPSASAGQAQLKWARFGRVENTGLKVPLDYGNPSAGMITLSVARLQAGDPAHRIGTLFLNPGGPGASAVGILNWPGPKTSIPQEVFDRFDLVTWDPRGVGLSAALSCPDEATAQMLESLDPDPSTPAALEAYRATHEDMAAQCQKTGAAILPYLSEANTARDMDAIRAALGETTISYLGWSYGTYLGYLYATLFPSHLRAAVLDGPVDPVQDLLGRTVSQGRGFDAAFANFLALCAKTRDCAFHGGGSPAKAYDALIAKLPRSASGTALDAGQAVQGVANWLYGSDFAGLATALASAERGDGSSLQASAAAYYQILPVGAYHATVCLDVSHPATAAAVAAALLTVRSAAPRFGPSGAAADLYGCLPWPVPAQPVAVSEPPAGLPPILVVASTRDPATPPWEAAPMAKALGTGVVLTRDGIGHTSGDSATTNACLRTALVAYFVTLTVPPAGTVCKDPPPSFKP
ncbi:MAG: alpha/beta hydrolase [Chloroflexota bacterium]